MLIMQILKTGRVALAAVAATVMLSGAAGAAILQVKTGTTAGSTTRGEITCSLSCEGLFGPASSPVLSDLYATLYDQSLAGSADPDDVADLLNDLTGTTSFTTSERTDRGAIPGATEDLASFTTDALFVALKLGNTFAFVKNTSGSIIDVTFAKAAGQAGAGAGFSNITEFGDVSAIPLPAAGWMLIGGLAGLGALGRRTRRQNA